MSEEKVLLSQKMTNIQCQNCWNQQKINLVFHVAKGCCCPMPICMSCLRKNSQENNSIICFGCNNPIRAVQLIDVHDYQKQAKKFCKTVIGESHQNCSSCLQPKKVWARHVTQKCTNDTEYCYDCAAGNICKFCCNLITKNNVTPLLKS